MPAAEGSAPEFSVIVPALDEEEELEETLRRARRALGSGAELIVVDGGSRDRTLDIARHHGSALRAGACRGRQLGLGAEAARGGVLVFLHADTWLPEGTGAEIRKAIARGIEAGCLGFEVRPATHDLRYRLLELGVNWRTRRFATATGDQAIFATRGAYRASGGFRPLPLFEDIDFVRSIRRAVRFEPLEIRALTSRRRWERGGFLRTVLAHWLLRAAFAAGAPPQKLDALYRGWTADRSEVSRW